MSSFWKKRLFIVSSKSFGKYTISDHYQPEQIELSNIIDSIYDEERFIVTFMQHRMFI